MENLQPYPAKNTIRIIVALYILYGLILMIETFDFLEMLHTKPKDHHPTYDLVNVIFYQMEMIICFVCAFSFIILISTKQSVTTWLFTTILLLLFRASSVYYLYFYETEERWVPFIYKEANDFSTLFRRTFVPAQLILNSIAIIALSKNYFQNRKVTKNNLP
ncbi:hypothetical protein FY557_07915 [Chryseobacterium sp. SN22]|uniref:hypothetical protein n=1 Tax=Chryseobacterium sp. SN22 TaxID=2606431 RepID=UPI0011EFA4C7|nr:hypothetical protein [Chryseobacterium sp. SN22]KAA0128795.1 hypothetical protein FY557_07915 [Chryseobacterium sp. SN22]